MTQPNIWKQSFEAHMVLEGSWGSRKLGKYSSTMELHLNSDTGKGFIEWDIPEIETTEHIGLWFSRNNYGGLILSDYDGVFSLPTQAISMLEEAGVFVDEEFH